MGLFDYKTNTYKTDKIINAEELHKMYETVLGSKYKIKLKKKEKMPLSVLLKA